MWSRHSRKRPDHPVTLSAREPALRINAFFYTNAPEGQKVRCPIRVIPGLSPLRQVLIGAGVLTEAELGFQGWTFAMDRILWDEYRPDPLADSDPSGELAAQIARLPEDVRAAVRILPHPPLFVLCLPVADEIEARIGLKAGAPWEIRAVHLVDCASAQTSDVTASVAGNSSGLNLDHLYLVLLDQVHRRERPHSVGLGTSDAGHRVSTQAGSQDTERARSATPESRRVES